MEQNSYDQGGGKRHVCISLFFKYIFKTLFIHVQMIPRHYIAEEAAEHVLASYHGYTQSCCFDLTAHM